MFEKALLATDLSDSSDCVIGAIGGLHKLGTQEILLVHCLNIRDVGPLANSLIQLAKPILERQKTILEMDGFVVQAKVVLGLPQIELERQAEEHGCSFMVVGSHGESVATEVLLGSVASAVVHHARRPILVMRIPVRGREGAEKCGEWKCDCLKHILFPTDFSDNAEHAFEYVRYAARRGTKEATLLHVQDRSRIDRHLKEKLEEFNRIDTERLQRLKSELEKDGVSRVNIELPYGLPKQEILSRINRGDISLVILGSQGRGYVRELLLGSVSHAVLRGARVPILLIPALAT